MKTIKAFYLLLTIPVMASSALGQSALDRFTQSKSQNTLSTQFRMRVSNMADVIADLEAHLGTAEVSANWVNSIVTHIFPSADKFEVELEKLSLNQIYGMIDLVRESAEQLGNTQTLRTINEIIADIRFENDPRSALIEIYHLQNESDLKSHLEKFIADNGGSVSQVLRNYLRISRYDDEIELTDYFGMSRKLLAWAEEEMEYYGWHHGLWAGFCLFVGAPFTLTFDFIVFPFLAIPDTAKAVGGWIGDLFKSTPADEKLASERTAHQEERTELNQKIDRLENEIEMLRKQLAEEKKKYDESGDYNRR